jgi:hypothetical protein
VTYRFFVRFPDGREAEYSSVEEAFAREKVPYRVWDTPAMRSAPEVWLQVGNSSKRYLVLRPS